MNNIVFTPGTIYDPAHLRAFDLELALAGHPLAMRDGEAVRLFRSLTDDEASQMYALDYWGKSSWIDWRRIPRECNVYLRLAPLCVKDGRALHVGDEIEVRTMISGSNPPEWRRSTASIVGYFNRFYLDEQTEWRWPERKE